MEESAGSAETRYCRRKQKGVGGRDENSNRKFSTSQAGGISRETNKITPLTFVAPLSPLSDSVFSVSLIDNVHSDIARLRGFYGHLVIEGRDLILVEARSGAEQVRWPVKVLKKWFTAKESIRAKEDREKVVVFITHK